MTNVAIRAVVLLLLLLLLVLKLVIVTLGVDIYGGVGVGNCVSIRV